jgi:hypothetical protein
MECVQAKQMMQELLDGDLGDEGRRELGLHVLDCPDCGSHYEQLRQVDDLAWELQPESPSPQFVQRVMECVDSESQTVVAREQDALPHWMIAVLVIAAVAGVFLGERITGQVSGDVPSFLSTGANWVSQSAASLVSLLASAVDTAAGAFESVWPLLDRYQSPLPVPWLVAAGLLAFAAVVLFHAAELRRNAASER